MFITFVIILSNSIFPDVYASQKMPQNQDIEKLLTAGGCEAFRDTASRFLRASLKAAQFEDVLITDSLSDLNELKDLLIKRDDSEEAKKVYREHFPLLGSTHLLATQQTVDTKTLLGKLKAIENDKQILQIFIEMRETVLKLLQKSIQELDTQQRTVLEVSEKINDQFHYLSNVMAEFSNQGTWEKVPIDFASKVLMTRVHQEAPLFFGRYLNLLRNFSDQESYEQCPTLESLLAEYRLETIWSAETKKKHAKPYDLRTAVQEWIKSRKELELDDVILVPPSDSSGTLKVEAKAKGTPARIKKGKKKNPESSTEQDDLKFLEWIEGTTLQKKSKQEEPQGRVKYRRSPKRGTPSVYQQPYQKPAAAASCSEKTDESRREPKTQAVPRLYLTADDLEVFKAISKPHYPNDVEVKRFLNMIYNLVHLNKGGYFIEIESMRGREDHRNPSGIGKNSFGQEGDSIRFVRYDGVDSQLAFHYPHGKDGNNGRFFTKEFRKRLFKIFEDFNVTEDSFDIVKLSDLE